MIRCPWTRSWIIRANRSDAAAIDPETWPLDPAHENAAPERRICPKLPQTAAGNPGAAGYSKPSENSVSLARGTMRTSPLSLWARKYSQGP